MKTNRYPAWVKMLVGALSNHVLGIRPEVEAVFAERRLVTNTGYALKLQTLWACAHRAWKAHGHENGAPRTDQEWQDLQAALSDVKDLNLSDMLGKRPLQQRSSSV